MTQPNLPSSGNEPEKDPLRAAYQRLKEARDAVDAATVHTMPLSELSAITDELKEAKKDFETAQGTQLITVNGHTLWRREYEALEQLARLNNKKIDDLVDGIKEVKNGRVSSLDLTSQRLTDISPLAGLTQLRELWLSKNEISDISPLAGLTQLALLGLSENNIQDISPLAGLTQLRHLVLRDNNIQDISPLTGLNQLERLYLSENNIQDISSLADLTQLRWLEPSNNNIQDISPLASLTQLRKLYLIDNNQVDTSLHNGIMGIFRGIFPQQLKNRESVQQLQNHGCKITGIEQ